MNVSVYLKGRGFSSFGHPKAVDVSVDERTLTVTSDHGDGVTRQAVYPLGVVERWEVWS